MHSVSMISAKCKVEGAKCRVQERSPEW